MVLIHSEVAKSKFKGTVIDIESIGEFCPEHQDSRHYQNITPVILGYISKDGLKIHCAKGMKSLGMLRATIVEIVPGLERPLYAFNCDYERGVLFHSCEIALDFDGELNKEKFESKKHAVALHGIKQYNDPFDDDGLKCSKAWQKGQLQLSMRHNRSCLLKERDLLLKRGHRKPDDLELFGHD